MAPHANRAPENPQFLEAQRLVRELLRTAGIKMEHGCVKLHIINHQLEEMSAQAAEKRVRLRSLEP